MEGHSSLGEQCAGPQSSTGATLYLQSQFQEFTRRNSRVVCVPMCTCVRVQLWVSGGEDSGHVCPSGTWFPRAGADQSIVFLLRIFWGPESEFPKSPCYGIFAIFHSQNHAEGNICVHKSLFRAESMRWIFWVKTYTVVKVLATVSNRAVSAHFEPRLGKRGLRGPEGRDLREGGGGGPGSDLPRRDCPALSPAPSPAQS